MDSYEEFNKSSYDKFQTANEFKDSCINLLKKGGDGCCICFVLGSLSEFRIDTTKPLFQAKVSKSKTLSVAEENKW